MNFSRCFRLGGAIVWFSLILLAEMAAGDVVLQATLRDEVSIHGAAYDPVLNTTLVKNYWITDVDNFPALAGQSGNLVLEIRAPVGQRLVVNHAASLLVEAAWSTRIGSPNVITQQVFPAAHTFVGPAVNPPVLPGESRFALADYSIDGKDLNSALFRLQTAGVVDPWSFSGLNLVSPLPTFQTTNVISPPIGATGVTLLFSYSLAGNQTGNPPPIFTFLVPELSALAPAALGCVLVSTQFRGRPGSGRSRVRSR